MSEPVQNSLIVDFLLVYPLIIGFSSFVLDQEQNLFRLLEWSSCRLYKIFKTELNGNSNILLSFYYSIYMN